MRAFLVVGSCVGLGLHAVYASREDAGFTKASVTEGADVVVFGSRLSPFSVIVTSYMRYQGIPFEWVEVDPLQKHVLQVNGVESKVLPVMRIKSTKRDVAKAEQIISFCHDNMVSSSRLGDFSPALRNQCMMVNEEVLPLVALCRHMTLDRSRQACLYLSQDTPASFSLPALSVSSLQSQWGHWRHSFNSFFVPIMQWRMWRKMGSGVLRETGNSDRMDRPQEALFSALQRWDDKRQGREYHGGGKPNMLDLWMHGMISSFKQEKLMQEMETSCPQMAQWMHRMDHQFQKQSVTEGRS